MSASTHPDQEQECSPGACVCCIIVLIGICLLLGFAISYDNTPFRFQVDSLSVNPMSSNTNVNGSNLNLTLSVKNHLPIKFKSIQVVLAYPNGDSVVASKEHKLSYVVEKADQIKKINMGMNISNDSVFFKDLLRSEGDGLTFTINVTGPFWTNWGYWEEGPVTLHQCEMNVVCENIRVKPTPSFTMTPVGSIVDGPIHCKYNSPTCDTPRF